MPNPQQQEALAALAQYGTAGQAAYDRAIANIQASQNAALGQMASQAGGMSVTPEGIAELQGIASVGSNAFQNSLQAARATQAADAARLQGSASNYYGQLEAAIPAGQAWAAAQGKSQLDLLKGEFDIDMAKWRMQKDEEDRQRAAAEAEERSRYGGFGSATEYENAVTARARAGQQAAVQQAHAAAEPIRRTAAKAELDRSASAYQAAARPTLRTPRHPEAPRGSFSRVRAALGGLARPQARPRPPDQQVARQLQQREQQAREAQVPVRQAERETRDPLNLYEFARDVAINQLGGNPDEAMGRFSPEWAQDIQLDEAQRRVAEQRAAEQLGNISMYGQLAEPEMEPTTRGALGAARVGSPEELAAVYDSDEYGAADADITEAMDAGEVATQQELVGFLVDSGYPPEIIRLLTYQYDYLP